MNKKYLSFIILFCFDVMVISFAIFISVYVRNDILCYFIQFESVKYESYITYPFPYMLITMLFAYFGLYNRRYDFWQELSIIFKVHSVSFIILFATLALGKNIEYYSRIVLILMFSFSCFLLPLVRSFIKIILFKIGIWKKKVKVIGDISKLDKRLINSPYTGYELDYCDYDVLFISSYNISPDKLNKLIELSIRKNKEILFVPILSQYDFSQSVIYQNFNFRANIFALENKLLSKINFFAKTIMDYLLSVLLFPVWGSVIFIISLLMKMNDKNGNVFFLQERLGKDGKVFYCYKFRTMVSDQSFMEQWLKDNPEEKEYYDRYHKYINDPRVTKLGNFLRKTSLDELPQLFNVLKGEMSLVGSRPYMVTEKNKMGDFAGLILASKPGITGLWQVSGRSETSFDERLSIDSWYIKNWSLWNDFIILLKTISVVIKRKGAS